VAGLKAIETGRLRFAWLLFRVPIFLVAAYLLREPILNLIERTVDIVWVTVFTIQVMSTPLTRLLLLLVAALGFFALAKLCERMFGGARGYFASVGAAALLAAALGEITGGGLRVAAPVLVVLAFNWAPLSLLARAGLTWPRLSAAIVIPPGIGEGLFASRYLSWLKASWNNREPQPSETPAKIPGAIIAALAVALLANAAALAPAERMIRTGDDVRVIAHGDFNGLALDGSQRYLFVTGHGVENLLRFDVADLDAPPLAASAVTGRAQGLAYDAGHGEIFMYRSSDRALVTVDEETLEEKRVASAAELSPGDPWVVYDRFTDTVTLASEADIQTGSPFLVLDRQTGAARDVRDIDGGLLALNPSKPILYMSFFRRARGVLAYDIASSEIVARGPSDARMDRLGFDPIANEVLVPSPMESRILRYDPDTLELRGSMRIMFGVRELAIDTTRKLMLTASIATGEVAMVDMETRRVVRRWYLGAWLRTIVLSPERGRAYVSSNGVLYELRYADAASTR